eukprot:CAMPEP_0202894456 /NCGR_PEP_ID=MMETSP1392-20130828/3866_1 /ASSEMBLY_ACC=CAM_ASM_000868 /TAXON_ID=225041 /ORGANISM="Chlamydomonas chlamydogama, Strain SAG 11-48b" /LENGTH=444 /DNA_ID=CAMNT_0049579165 /DNA_START=76 /DNA_END=1406 /DNA_ORIENTATION=+
MSPPKVEPVCAEPKVFAGQIPVEATQDDVYKLFSQYGNIKNCVIITGPDGRSKGCAMILYERWAEVELAVENENGTTNLGGTKPMVVRVADPPKRGDGPIMGIAPKKLFVGQIPATLTELELRNLFLPYGNIVEVHLLKKNPGAACAFVTYERWAMCEAAIEAHNGKTHLEGAKMPMVVKFADAKVDGMGGMGFNAMGMAMAGMAAGGMKRPFNAMETATFTAAAAGAAAGSNKKPFTGGMGGAGYNAYGMGGGYDMNAMAAMANMGYGMGMNPMASMMGMGMGMPMGMGMGANRNNGNMMMQSSRLGSGVQDEAAKQWKLFVGQVPFEAREQDLWPLFAEIGNILELVVLRNPQGRSRGCAFVTYENRMLAEKAIRQIDGKMCLPNDPKQRLLIVKYANSSGTGNGSSGGQAAAPNPNMGGQGMGMMGNMGGGMMMGGMGAGG